MLNSYAEKVISKAKVETIHLISQKVFRSIMKSKRKIGEKAMVMEMDLSEIEYDKFCTRFHSSTTTTLNKRKFMLVTPVLRTHTYLPHSSARWQQITQL